MERELPPLDNVINITSENFTASALQMFYYQAKAVPVYREFLQLLDVKSEEITALHQIPFLPVELFKTHSVIANGFIPEKTFESSGTTDNITSKHPVANLEIYKQSIVQTFKKFYGNPKDYCILALLPSYIERNNASLIFMCNFLMELSGNINNGFYLNNQQELADTLKQNESKKIKTLLIGVSFALLDFAEKFPMPLTQTIIMETGGMKGRRKEITRHELHTMLMQAFQLKTIHSEYGMTELLSQAYSTENGIFFTPPWMRILIRDTTDPFTILETQKNGLINIIDLANTYSCSFIATQDTGMLYTKNSFGVTGRFDTADVRGCNLMVV